MLELIRLKVVARLVGAVGLKMYIYLNAFFMIIPLLVLEVEEHYSVCHCDFQSSYLLKGWDQAYPQEMQKHLCTIGGPNMAMVVCFCFYPLSFRSTLESGDKMIPTPLP